MILIITNRQDQTADFLILELQRLHADFVRFNTEDFPNKVNMSWSLSNGKLDGTIKFQSRQISFDHIKSAWYRRPTAPDLLTKVLDQETARFILEESQTALDGVWKTLDCFWVSKPDKIRAAENKMFQLKTAVDLGFSVWPTMVTSEPNAAIGFCHLFPDNVVYKPLRKGRLIRGDKQSLIFTNLVDSKLAKDLHRVQFSPSLFQKYIHKSIELRVTVIGSKVFSFSIDSQINTESMHDWRRSQKNLPISPYSLPFDLQEKCRLLVKRFCLKFGAIDLIVTPDNEFVFLEINPNGQWAWLQQLHPQVPLRETLAELLISGGGNF